MNEKRETRTKIELPGIDDCDWLYLLCSRSGHSSVYFHVHQFDAGIFAQLSVDCGAPEGDNFCQDLSDVQGPFKAPEEAALALLPAAKEWFQDNDLRYVYDNNLRKIVRRLK